MSRIPANPDFDHRIADWLEDDPDHAPGAVLGTVLAALPSIPQRRASRVPWRFQPMNRFALIGAAAATIVVVGLGGLLLTSRPNSPDPVGGPPTTSPASSPSPSPSAALPPPLTETFTSSMHGISIAYPGGWQAKAATQPWSSGWAGFDDPAGDILFDPAVDDGHLFISLASRPLEGATGDKWTADMLALPEPQGYECGFSTAPITVDGGPGRTGCHAATVAVGGRGYLILLYTSDDLPSTTQALYDQAWFEALLATVDLRPDGVVEPVSSPAG